jgi:hypothetical protein
LLGLNDRPQVDDEWRTPSQEGSGADTEKVLADESRPEAVSLFQLGGTIRLPPARRH